MPQIIIDEKLCTRCNTCSAVCVLRIVEKATESSLPAIAQENLKACFLCGHCEAFCPQKALTLEFRLEEKKNSLFSDAQIDPLDLSSYIKRRRSIRRYSSQLVPKELIARVIDVARYAPSGGNSQTVRWTVFRDPSDVKKIAELTVDWMRTLLNSSSPLAGYVMPIVSAWDRGVDGVCRNAPHLLLAHVPCNENGYDPVDAIIALTHIDITAPSFGLGTCWAGFVKMAADKHKPLQDFLAIPPERRMAYAMIFGYPSFKPSSVPRRNPVKISWR
jgi:nitroreductase/Pyruvate/2-oxoacid:ferredoxin oxidoreductase delta subunit